MAFESLTEKFQRVFKKMRGESTLSEKNIEGALGEIRVALLESDVNYKVVKEFLQHVREKALGQEVLLKVNPSEMLVKICHDELLALLGSGETALKRGKPLTTILLVGLQGSGKTTTAGKLALRLKAKEGRKPLLAGLDVYRPAAIDQLREIASKIDVPFFSLGTKADPVDIALKAREEALSLGRDTLILDTAGRLQIDEPLMEELRNIIQKVHPEESLLLVDAMAGQDAVNVAKAFHESVPLTGIVMSKLDGDAKGGAALSIKHMSGLPIKFAGVGEKLEDLEEFHPDRMADRILGMGDVVSLVEKAQEVISEKEAARAGRKMLEGEFTLEDMIDQMKMVRRIGSLGAIAKMIPGMPSLTDEQKERAEREMKIFEVVVSSMTPYERRHPECLKNSRKQRIARGSGTTQADVNRVLRKYEQSRDMMKKMKGLRGGRGLPPGFRGF